MKKKLRLLMTMLLMAVMGSAWAEDVTFYFSDYYGKGTQSVGSEYTMVKDDVSITGSKFYCSPTANGYAQFYANGTITITPATGVVITKIEIKAISSYNGYQDGGTITASAGSVTNTSNTLVTWTGSASEAFTLVNNKQIRWSQIKVTIEDASPAYPITAQSNNESYGTVSLRGIVITGSPNSGCRYANPAYTVSPANSATVTQDGNKFTVTPSAATTVTINFEAIPMYTVTLGDDNSTLTETTGGAGVTLPTRDALDDDYIAFAGWSETNVSTETPTAPTIIPAGEYYPTANMTLYPVYTKLVGGTEPTPFTVGSTGDYAIVSAPQNGKYYALPTKPTVSSGKITAQEITVSEKNGVKYVETTNASGFTWTIAPATNGGYTLYDGSKYIYHSNGGSSGTNLVYGTSTTLKWAFTVEGDFVKMAGMNGSTTYSRGMLFQNTTIGGYALSNWNANNYYKTMILPIVDLGTAYYWSGLPAFEVVEFATDGYKTYVTENPIDWEATLERNNSDIDVHGYKAIAFSVADGVSLVEFGKENLPSVAATDAKYQEPITPAETPMIIMGKQGKNYLVISPVTTASAPSGNLFRKGDGVATTTLKDNGDIKVALYVMQKIDVNGSGIDNYKFYRLTPGRTVPVGKAYLSSENMTLPTTPTTPIINNIKSSYPMRVLEQEDEQLVSEDAGIVDGIGMNYQEGKDNVYYNVNGMRIANPSKGIYIVNGRKVVLK